MVDLAVLRVIGYDGVVIPGGAADVSDGSDATYITLTETAPTNYAIFDSAGLAGATSIAVVVRYRVATKVPDTLTLSFLASLRDRGTALQYGTCNVAGPEIIGDYQPGDIVEATVYIDADFLNSNSVWLPDSTAPYTVADVVSEVSAGVDGEVVVDFQAGAYGSVDSYTCEVLSVSLSVPAEQGVRVRSILGPKEALFSLQMESGGELEEPRANVLPAKEATFALYAQVPVVPTPGTPPVGGPAPVGGFVVVAEATSTVTMSGTQAVYSVSSASEPRARQRILVDGRDITYFRGVVTPNVTYSLVEPFLYGPGSLVMPQVVGCFERLGVGDLTFLRPGAIVEIQYAVDNVIQYTGFKGVIVAFDLSGASLSVELGGEVTGRASLVNRQVPIFPRINDLGRQMADSIRDLGLKFNPPLGPITGIEMMTTGGSGYLDWMQDIVAKAWTRAGRKWTIMPHPVSGVYEAHRKNTTTIHATAFLDDAHTVGNLRRDISEEPNRIFGMGVTPRGQRVLNGVYPGLVQGRAPAFPGDMEMGDYNEGVQILIAKLHSLGYMKLVDVQGGYDEDVYDAVLDLQNDAGLFDDGFIGTTSPGKVDLPTWKALYDLNVTGRSLEYAHIEPMAERDKVKKWRRSGSGSIMRKNPNYDWKTLVVDRNIDFGSGITRSQMRRYSKNELYDSDNPNWIGDITFHTGALIKGTGTPGMTVTPADIFPATEIRPGQNIWLPLFDGGVLVHVAACLVDQEGTVSVTVDTRARDAMEAWEVIARNKESRNDPSRRANRRQRSSTVVKDSIGEWDEIGGLLGNDIELDWGWNVFPIVAAMEGTVSRIRLKINSKGGDPGPGNTFSRGDNTFGPGPGDGTPFEYVTAVFGKSVTPRMMTALVPNALDPGADKAWQTNRKELRKLWLLYAAGTNEEPCGYSPGLKKDLDPLTGLFEDDAGFAYRSETRTLVYVAVFLGKASDPGPGDGDNQLMSGDTSFAGDPGTESNARVQSGRIMWNQLESGV